MPFKILTIVGTRPNFIKVTQFQRYLNRPELGMQHAMLHTGQHYDDKMSQVFFEQFNLTPDFWLNVPPGSPNTQIAEIMMRMERVIKEQYTPDLVMVVGDVNSTLAAALCAHKMGIPFAHVESGLRSADRTMPEEINRLLTDEIADYYFVTEQSGIDHLLREGKPQNRIFFVGNTMIDTLVAHEADIQHADVLDRLAIEPGRFVLMTMHRPATVDHRNGLQELMKIIRLVTQNTQLVFPIHPRTRARFEEFGMKQELDHMNGLILAEPMDYFSFQKLVSASKYVLTDSGGIQEETTFRRVPCITLRPNTERPSTIEIGSNTLLPFDLSAIGDLIYQIEQGKYKTGGIPPLWDGYATRRISEVIENHLMRSPGLAH